MYAVKYKFQMLFMENTLYLDPILFSEGTLRFMRLKFWDLNHNGLTYGSEVVGNVYKSTEENWWQQKLINQD